MINTAVIMSVYKNDKLEYLREALDSLYLQTYKTDIYVQQDGVIPEILEEYLDNELKEERIVHLGKRSQNVGLAASLNELLTIVVPNYEYIVRMDADDISIHERIEKQVKFLDKNQEIDAVGGWIKEFNMDTGTTQVVRYGEGMQEIQKDLVKRNPMAHVTICFRNCFFDTIPTYDASRSNEDFDLWIRALKEDLKLHNLQEVLVQVRTSNAFFNRRQNFKRAWEVMFLKFHATRYFSFGITGYLYAIAHFLLFLSPSRVKAYVYKNLRG